MFRVITLFSCALAITTAPLLRWPPRLPVWRDGVVTVDTQTTPRLAGNDWCPGCVAYQGNGCSAAYYAIASGYQVERISCGPVYQTVAGIDDLRPADRHCQ